MVIFNFVFVIPVILCAKAQAETCNVGVDGCSWTCKSSQLPPGTATCLGFPSTPQSCVIGSSVTMCGTTCKCLQEKPCTVGVNGCKWSCVTSPPKPGVVQCEAYPATPTECYPGQTSSICGTTCTSKSQAETCDVGVDGCSWTCTSAQLPPGTATCLGIPGTPQSCEIGSSETMCGTTCTCSKSEAETCRVGEDGCSWDCTKAQLKPGQFTCLAEPGTPETCVIGSSVSMCGTTCRCSKAKTCTVGVKGCSWTCRKDPPIPGQMTCMAEPGTPETCAVGSSESLCGTTCTCSQEQQCTVGVNGCKWSCATSPPEPGTVQCEAFPETPTECYPGDTSSICGTTCECEIEEPHGIWRLLDILKAFIKSLFK